MKEKLEKMTHRRKKAHAAFLDSRSNVYRAFLEMEKAAYSDGLLEARYKELIAVGISVVINCESCMQWHIEQAIAKGSNKKEVLEAIDVGIEMGGGPATAHARFALEVLENLAQEG